MWVISDEQPVVVRTKTGDVHLEPGVPCELSDAIAQRVLERTGGRVRVIEPPSPETIIEPAAPGARLVYWEDSGGKLCGPAVPEYLAKTGSGEREHFWVVVTDRGVIRWIRSDRLRATPRTKPVGT